MNESSLWAEVEKRRAVTAEEKNYLTDEGKVLDALNQDFDEDQIAELIRHVDKLPNRPGAKCKAPGKAWYGKIDEESIEVPFAADLTDAERERALLFIEAQVRAAGRDPRVEEFRNRYCSGRLLSAEEAEEFLNSSDAPRLETVASHLQRLHGWNKGEAAWWVLTGEAPDCRPVKVSYRAAESEHSLDLCLITIEAPPWISPATFRGAFTEMRRRMHAERKPPDARSVRVVRFVEKLRNGGAMEKLAFKDMWRRWNQDHPKEAFSEPRSFETAYRRTSKVLQRQYNTEIEREETPELRRQRVRLKREVERIAKSRSS
jgi:hypothetical protein